MTREYTKEDLIKQLQVATNEIDLLKRYFDKQIENFDEVDITTYQDYIYKAEDALFDLNDELEGNT
tara:strand:- start:456 stop:653 length:198 start_codon:yes stop_codon:yes gene_type:complete